MKKSELNQIIKEVLSEDIFLQHRKSPEDKAKTLEQELDLECKVKFGVEVYEGDIKLTPKLLPYFKKYSKIKKIIGNFYCVELKLKSLLELPIPKYIVGNFNCSHNDLTTLEGAPEKVYMGVDCAFNNLISLKGAPVYTGGWFICTYNDLTTLEGAPEKVDMYFVCRDNPTKFTEEDVRKVCDVKGNVYS